MVCICVPTYNAAATVRETLESILAQSYPGLVVHVSDNASTDDTLKIVESLADKRITIHRQEKNIGAEGNFTKCIQLATGKYTAIFHADDIYESDMVAKQVAFLEGNYDIGAVFTEAVTIDEQGRPTGIIGRIPGENRKIRRYDFPEIIKTVLLHYNFLVCPSAMVRTHIYQDEILQWRGEMFRSSADGDTWFRLASAHPIAVLGEPLMRYRISNAQFSSSIRGRTARADFFLLMDYYIGQPEVRKFLTEDDLRHYGWLGRHDQVARAINLFALGRIAAARDLLPDLFCWDAIYAAIVTRRGLVTLLAGFLLQLLLMFGFLNMGNKIIKIMRKISWK